MCVCVGGGGSSSYIWSLFSFVCLFLFLGKGRGTFSVNSVMRSFRRVNPMKPLFWIVIIRRVSLFEGVIVMGTHYSEGVII